MIPRAVKAAYYALLAPFMAANGFIYRVVRAPRLGAAPIKAHLGPGQKNYLSGWINVDANLLTAKIDVWADLRNKLPFRDASVNVFYSHHVIEHLPDALLPFHFREMYRCLVPGGIIRVGGPHADNAMRKFLEGDAQWFPDFPDPRKSIGGRFVNFIFCRGEHLTALTLSYLTEIAADAGFENIQPCQPIVQTHYPDVIDQPVLSTEFEDTPDVPHTLIIEARKPPRPA